MDGAIEPSDFDYQQALGPPRGAWAPGDYTGKCMACKDRYMGDKRAYMCADCAYKELAADALAWALQRHGHPASGPDGDGGRHVPADDLRVAREYEGPRSRLDEGEVPDRVRYDRAALDRTYKFLT